MSYIHTSQVTALYHKIGHEYAEGKIDVETMVLGQGALSRLIKTTQGDDYWKLWIEEQHPAEGEKAQTP